MDQNARLQPVLIGVQILSLLPKLGMYFNGENACPTSRRLEVRVLPSPPGSLAQMIEHRTHNPKAWV